MISNYLIYLNSLSNEAKFNQIFIILIFLLILLIIGGFLKFLKIKFMNKNKNSLFQKFLEKIWSC